MTDREFFDTFSAVLKVVRARAAARYAELGLGSAQGKFLRHMRDGVSQAELARDTDTAPALLGRTIEPLIAHGFIRRERSAADRRQYILTLTPAGKRLRDKVEAARDALIAELGAAVDDRDRADFARIAKKLLVHLA